MSRRAGLIRWIAAERVVRGVILLAVGVVVITHIHGDWAGAVRGIARALGLEPSGVRVQRLATRAGALHPAKRAGYGVAAIGFGALEGVEGFGLWHRRRWAEHLTVAATSLLFVPEIWELTKDVTLLKLGGLAANIVVVAYLVIRLRRGE